MNNFKAWMRLASRIDKEVLARKAGTTVATLHQIAGGYRHSGEVHTTAELASRIAAAAEQLKVMPPVRAGDLSPVCRKCPHYCKK